MGWGGWPGIRGLAEVCISKPEEAQVIKEAMGEAPPSSGPAIPWATREVIIVSPRGKRLVVNKKTGSECPHSAFDLAL